ncbi:MAG: GNAT family N-acetyltransferase [Phycisphaerales bacterium]|nr:GNAT family N-acetyltransferase [Phycisphaerales bacterium]
MAVLEIHLRPVEPRDIPTLFEQQCDPDSNQLAGTKPRTREVFQATWDRIFTDPTVIPRVIIGADNPDLILGAISCFQHEGRDNVGYMIARSHWGKGIASRALALFLKEVPRRPLHATTSRANAPSMHILQKYGFRLTGYEMGQETDRYIAREIARFVLE